MRNRGRCAAFPVRLWLTALIASAALTASDPPASAQLQPNTLRPGGASASGGLLVLSGSLHDHSTDSDGDVSAAAVASWEFAHRDELGIDFGALTDHADYFPFAYRAPFGGNVWKRQARLSERFARNGFPFLRGFEYTSDQENHVSVIGSPDYLPGARARDFNLAALYGWLATRGTAIGQFNHPSCKGALQWDNLAFVRPVSANIAAIEIYGDQGTTGENLMHSDAGWYWLALTRGWTVGPVMNWDTHHWRNIMAQPDAGRRCGDLPHTLPCQRTLVLAQGATPAAILSALRARRTTATEHPSLWATLRGPGGIWQGSTVPNAQPGQTLELTLEAGSSIWPLEHVDIVGDDGIDPHRYYDGDNPNETRRNGPLATGFREQHRRFLRSGGYAVRKNQIDGPPPEATLASLSLSGNHTLRSITITIPVVRSLRPDGKHFFYAVVWAGRERAWTAPVFTEGAPRFAESDPETDH